MSLKILVVPALIIAILVIGIGYLKPDISLLFEKKAVFDQAVEQADQIDTVAKNIQSIKGQLSASAEDVDFLKRYLPDRSDTEREIDQLNYIASKSGVAVKDVQVIEMKKAVPVAPVQSDTEAASSASVLFGSSSGMGDVIIPLSVKKTYTPGTYTITVKSVGSYEAIKSFVANVMQAHRFLRIVESSIDAVQPDTSGSAPKQQNPDALESMLTVEFSVLPPVKADSALGDAAFDSPRLSLDTISDIRMHSEGDTPELPKAETGKSNLFQ